MPAGCPLVLIVFISYLASNLSLVLKLITDTLEIGFNLMYKYKLFIIYIDLFLMAFSNNY